jgi:hypothetical protein
LLELFWMYKQLPLPMELLPVSSREKCVEAAVRNELNERRAALGESHALALHEGLAGAARSFAQAQRLLVREANGDVLGMRTKDSGVVVAEVRALLARLPLPPGFHAAHLHFSSDELPRIFGLQSATGKAGTSMGGSAPADSVNDSVGAILSKEAVGFWSARQAADVAWPSAAIVGVGAALDYTVNRGFIVVLIAGFEDLRPVDAVTSSGSSLLQLEPRAKKTASAAQPAAGVWRPKFGANVKTFDGDARMHDKSGH